jgi:hypothetical protein
MNPSATSGHREWKRWFRFRNDRLVANACIFRKALASWAARALGTSTSWSTLLRSWKKSDGVIVERVVKKRYAQFKATS